MRSPKYNGKRFFKVLKSLGFILRFKNYDPDDPKTGGSVVGIMQLDLAEMGPKYDIVIAVSGNGLLIPAFEAIHKMAPKTVRIVSAFVGTLHSRYLDPEEPPPVEKVIYLDSSLIVRGSDAREESEA